MSNQMSEVMKYNRWAKNQLVVLLTSPNMREFEFDILKKSDDLLYAFQKISDERLYESLYNPQYEQKKLREIS